MESRRSRRQSVVLVHGPFTSRYWYLKGARHDYEPVLFIGGAFQTKRSLVKFAEVFAKSADVILVDLPGTGNTDIPPPEVGGDFFADCIGQLLDQVGIARINLVGVSFGSAIAYTFAQRHPDRVANLVLIGTMSHADRRIEEALELSFDALDRGDMESFANRVSRVLMNYEKRLDIPQFKRGERLLRMAFARMTEREIEQFRINGRRILLHRRLDKSLPVPVRALVFTGEHDSVTTPEHCLEVASTISDSHLVLVRDADHLAVLERFEVCAQLTDSFLRGLRPKKTSDYAAVRYVGIADRGARESSEDTNTDGRLDPDARQKASGPGTSSGCWAP